MGDAMNSGPRLPVKGPLVWPPRLGPKTENRYRTIIQLLARGLTAKEMAQAIGISYESVKHDCQRMRAFFGAATNTEAVLIAQREWNLKL